jgi:polyphosphate glucokinase
MTELIGVDIGGSGVKGAPVDLATGELAADRHRIETPQPSTPEAVAAVVAEVVGSFTTGGPIGCTFPGIVRRGVIRSAANVDPAWLGTDAAALFREATGRPVVVLNDADAAGLAEARFGAARGRDGVVLVLTFGTGIGSALLNDGELVPNTELGHLELDGQDAEDAAAAAVRDDEGLSWEEWAARVEHYLQHVEGLFSPDLIVVGGGVSKRFDKFADHLDVEAEVVPAELRNNAGIAGAALVAAGLEETPA